MKTPKRYPATMSVYATRDELRQDRARWKRKNRIAQYKRTIAKYKLWYEATRDILRNVSLELKELQDEYLPK